MSGSRSFKEYNYQQHALPRSTTSQNTFREYGKYENDYKDHNKENNILLVDYK